MGFSMASHLNIGVRHIMPVFPFFAVMGAGAAAAFLNIERLKRWHVSRVLVGVLAAWIILIAITAFPNYTTYFSPLAGGPANGWRLLSDSNVETGQDVNALAAFLKERGETETEGLFVGSGYFEYYGVDNCDIPCNSDENSSSDETGDDDSEDERRTEPDEQDKPVKYVAIGAWYLEEINLTPEQKAVIDPYRSMQPEAVIGNAIFVFRKKYD